MISGSPVQAGERLARVTPSLVGGCVLLVVGIVAAEGLFLSKYDVDVSDACAVVGGDCD